MPAKNAAPISVAESAAAAPVAAVAPATRAAPATAGKREAPRPDDTALLARLNATGEKARKQAAIDIGKLKNTRFLPRLLQAAQNDASSAVRREATAAIGRMKDAAVIPALCALTKDDDPKVIMQALRGLLCHPKSKDIHIALERLKKHPNEMIRNIIERERSYYIDSAADKTAHVNSPDYMKNVVVNGDALATLKAAPKESIHLTFTSPPYYNARDYSIYSSYAGYLKFLEKVFRAVHRATKPGRFFVLNTSPIIVPRVSRAHASRRYPIPFDIHPLLMKMGWEFIDDIVWSKPEASVKNRNGGFYQHRKPLAYKPNSRTEYLMVYRKATPRLIDWNIRHYPPDVIKKSLVTGAYDTGNIWEVDPTFDKTHSAVFPAKLCQKVISYYSMAGDLVFDPFGGSGTLGLTASYLGRHFFMTELSPDYIARMKERFEQNKNYFFTPASFMSLEAFKQRKKRGV